MLFDDQTRILICSYKEPLGIWSRRFLLSPGSLIFICLTISQEIILLWLHYNTISFNSLAQVSPPDDVMTALLQINETLALDDSIITQLQESRDIPQLAKYVSMYASIVNEATRLSVASIGNVTVANMTANETKLILEEASLRMNVSLRLFMIVSKIYSRLKLAIVESL